MPETPRARGEIHVLVLPDEDYGHIASQISETGTGMARIARHVANTILPELAGKASI